MAEIWYLVKNSYRYPISWEAFLDPSDSYFLFAEERGYHTWALAHSSSCIHLINIYERLRNRSGSTNMLDYIMTSNFNLRIPKQAWFHCDVKLSQTCPIRSHKRARFYKETCTCTCHKCVPFVAYTILVVNTHKKDETFKMAKIIRAHNSDGHVMKRRREK